MSRTYLTGRYKVRKEPSPAKRCEKSGKDAKRAVLWKKNRLCYIELDLIALTLLKINIGELQILYDFFMRNTVENGRKGCGKDVKRAYFHLKRSTAMYKQGNK